MFFGIISSMEELGLSSRSYFLWNNSLGFEVLGRDMDVQTEVASLTKIMTALLVLETRDLAETVVITPEMLSGLYEFAVIGLTVGQAVTVEDLLYATLLPSAGDAAQALAISTSGSIANFADLMNKRAQGLGMANTHFSNPVGKDEENYSTPRDIAILLSEALKNPTFVEMFETFEKYLPTLGITVRKTFRQTGYTKGGKTGYTEAAGRCLASTAEIEGTEYILVTIGALPGQNVVDTERVYAAVEAEYEPVQIMRAGEEVLRVGVEQSATKVLEFVAESDVTVALPNGIEREDLAYEYDGVQEVTRETTVGEKLGTFTIWQDEAVLYAQEIYYTEEPEFYNYSWVGLGAGVSVLLLLVAMVIGVCTWRKRKSSWLILILLVLFGVSVGANVWLFHDWFEPGGETEVTWPGTRLDEIISEDDAVREDEVDKEDYSVHEGNLMLINPNFMVDKEFIASRKQELVSVSELYGIKEYNASVNGDNLLTAEAAENLNAMLAAYKTENPGHEMGTRSCFRERGTNCGRLCAATGASDHHTGLTCDLIDLQYGTSLDTADYAQHKEWQWLKANSYKYGFIDRFPLAWSGGLMSEPLNVDENGTTGLYETWHYRYVGVEAATEIATGVYNNGEYDSLEHYLKATGRVLDLKNGVRE